ncbi:hypothetical protein KFE94_17260 [bacterium SCSIO 12643]|nr:hypothetical protein KFE94_17260 [bacterium SCSIO 12643]
MKTIPKYLIEKIVAVTHGSLSVKAFESWLYENEELSDQITKDAFVLELYAINYSKKGVKYALEKLLTDTLGQDHFQMYKIKMLLESLQLESTDLLRILDQLYNLWTYNDYSFLEHLSHCYFMVEECESYHMPVPDDTQQYIREEATVLLNVIQQGMDKDHVRLEELSFPKRPSLYDALKSDGNEIGETLTQLTTEATSKKSWWTELFSAFKFKR